MGRLRLVPSVIISHGPCEEAALSIGIYALNGIRESCNYVITKERRFLLSPRYTVLMARLSHHLSPIHTICNTNSSMRSAMFFAISLNTSVGHTRNEKATVIKMPFIRVDVLHTFSFLVSFAPSKRSQQA